MKGIQWSLMDSTHKEPVMQSFDALCNDSHLLKNWSNCLWSEMFWHVTPLEWGKSYVQLWHIILTFKFFAWNYYNCKIIIRSGSGRYIYLHVDGLMQKRWNSITNTLELHLFGIKSLSWPGYYMVMKLFSTMASILQMGFSNTFPWNESDTFWFISSFILRVQLLIRQYWFIW